jgi:hypothetical protein
LAWHRQTPRQCRHGITGPEAAHPNDRDGGRRPARRQSENGIAIIYHWKPCNIACMPAVESECTRMLFEPTYVITQVAARPPELVAAP